MAKKKKEEGTVEATSSIHDAITKEFGNVLFDAKYILERKRPVVSISPIIDLITNGGIPFGSFVIPTGPPKVGKTTFALHAAGKALAVPPTHTNPRRLYVFNIEGRLKPRDLMGIAPLRPFYEQGMVKVIESSPGNIIAGEKYIAMGEKLINEEPGCIFLFDSFSQLCSSKRRANEIGEAFRDDMPIILSDFCKRICNVIPVNDSLVFGITHRIANTSGMGRSMYSEASGNKIQYQVDVKMDARYKTPWKVGEKQIGQDVHWECECSCFGTPNMQGISKLRYGEGIDEVAELCSVATDIGLIKKGGAWYTLPNGDQFQGLEKLTAFLGSDEPANKEMYNEIYQQYREAMGFVSGSV